MTHPDEHTPELPPSIREAARDYNAPPTPTASQFDAMWAAIEAKSFRADIGGRVTDHDSRIRTLTLRWFAPRAVLQIAATLVIGVAIGRYALPASNALPAASVSRGMMLDTLALAEPYYSTTTRYFGQTAALLVALPSRTPADTRLRDRAHDLLLTTRLLLDSPAADDPRIRGLLEDLELVLAQVTRLQPGGDQGTSELELIHQAMDTRDVLPRLRTAVVDISAGDE